MTDMDARALATDELADKPPEPAAEPSLGRAVRRGAMWSAASTLSMRLANIAIMAVVARTLAPRDFGVFAVAMTVHLIVSSIAELGVGSSLLRNDLDAEALAPTVSTIAIITSCSLASCMVLFARPLSAALGSEHAAGPMRVLAIAVVLQGFFTVPGAQLAREFKQNKIFLANGIGFLASNSLLLVLALHGSGAMSFAWSRVVGQLVVGTAITLMAQHRPLPGFAPEHLKLLFGFGLPLAGANLLNYVLLNADYAIVGRLLGPVDLGIYMLAFNIASWPSAIFSAMLNSVAMPAFSKVKHDPEQLASALKRGVSALALVALPICALTASLSSPLVRTVYGSKWTAAAHPLSILAVYGAISICCLLFANVLAALGAGKSLLIAQLPWLAALVPAMAIGVRSHGIVGAAYAHIVVVCLIALPVYLRLLRRASSVRLAPVASAVWPILLAALAAAGVAYSASRLPLGSFGQLIVGGLAGSLCYTLAVLPMASSILGTRTDRLPRPLGQLIDGYTGSWHRVATFIKRRPAGAHSTRRVRPSSEATPETITKSEES